MKRIYYILVLLLLQFNATSQSNNCSTLEPICTDVGLNFTAQTGVSDASSTNSGNNYGCLSTSPNPTWYYVEVATAGAIDMDLSAGSDIDFALWGPFSSLSNAQANCDNYGSPIDCSYSTSATETANIPSAQVGEVYVLLITNYASVSQNITLTQSGGTGATDCTILNCSIDYLDANVTACSSGTFDITGQVQFSNPPTSGQLVVTTCSGDQQTFNAPFTSPINYSIAGITADGTTGCSVTASFTADGACTSTTPTFTEPVCTCSITNFTANIGACDPSTDSYTVDGTVSYSDAPSSGTLIVEVNDGSNTYTTSINSPFSGSDTWSIPGIPSNGANITISVYFSADPSCTTSLTSTAPSSCVCSAVAGTFSGSTTGDGLNNYVLCYGDQIDLSSDLNYTPPGDENISGITYDPGIAYLAYTCPPTVLPTAPLWDPTTGNANDPCLIGVVSFGDDLTDINTTGAPPNFGSTYTNNTIYYVPITTYSNVDHYYASSINGGPWCYDMGSTFAVQYLPEITTSESVTCTDVTVTINGGLPAVDGSNFTLSNLLPATATLSTTSVADGGTVTITGLQDGDSYSFDIIDGNGCPVTFTGGPFVGQPVADAGPDNSECSFSYTLAAVPSVGTGTWTSSPAGATFAPNANDPNATATVSSAGSYTFTWTEVNGSCTDADDVVIQFSNLSYTENVTQSTCGNADGAIDITAADGITAYTYSIDGGSTSQASGSFPNLVAGAYNILVEDAIGCQVTGTSSVTDQGGPTIDGVTPVDVTCSGNCDGSIAINATGATLFSIDGGTTFQASNSFTGLCSGTYNIVVENGVGCQAFDQTTINEPAAITYSSSTVDLLCNNVCIGEIDVTATGGFGTLQYSDDGGATFQTNNVFSNLCAGNYNVVVEDANGCQITNTETITEPVALTLTLGITDATCAGQCDGMINSIPSGGSSPYTYTWGPTGTGGNVPLVSNLCTGTYTLTVADQNGCSIDTTITVTGPQAVTIDNISVTDEQCFGDCNGSATITSTGAIQYSIDGVNYTTSNTFTGLCAGNYVAYAQDINGCESTQSFTIGSPAQVTLTADGDTTICIGGVAQLSSNAGGGVGGFTYSWDNGAGSTQNVNVSPTSPQVYCVTATDANGCSSSPICLTVSLFQPLSVLAFSDIDICPGETADISGLASGGNGGPYNYSWDQGIGAGSAQTVGPNITTTYTVTATDGCETPSASADVTITVNTLPNISFEGDNLAGCMPVQTNFTSTNVPTGSSCVWSFGDGGVSTDCGTTSYSFTQPGCWDVNLSIITPEGCNVNYEIQDYVCVYDYPTPDFTFGPQPTTVLEPTINFTDESFNAVSYQWVMDTNGASDTITDENPNYTFPAEQPGSYEVCLTAFTQQGCSATVCDTVIIGPEYILYVPNAFTPDQDGPNETFYPVIQGEDVLTYEFYIFNRWGELIFESHHPSQGWDGTYRGVMSQTDVYVWKLKVKDATYGKVHEYIGHVTLLR